MSSLGTSALSVSVVAIALVAAGSDAFGSGCIATGSDPAREGYLRVCMDQYGSWGSVSFGGNGDAYNPVDGLANTNETCLTSGFYMFRSAELQRELLSDNAAWQALHPADSSLSRRTLGQVVRFDASGNGVFDTAHSVFAVTGVGVDLTFDVESCLAQFLPVSVGLISVLVQDYTITNNLGTPIEFELIRVFDGDLYWSGGESDFANDTVGTELPGQSVFIQEQDLPETRIMMSCTVAETYFGTKRGIDPDGAGPDPAMGYGTDIQIWNAYGLPVSWANFIPGVGVDLAGESGPSPAGCIAPCDASIGLVIPVALLGGETVHVNIDLFFGEESAHCPWDCGNVDGQVGIEDFLTLLAMWGSAGSCDFDGGGVGISDFLSLLANWGPCS